MERIAIGEVSLEVLMAGEGPPLLFLHGGDYFLQTFGGHRYVNFRNQQRVQMLGPAFRQPDRSRRNCSSQRLRVRGQRRIEPS